MGGALNEPRLQVERVAEVSILRLRGDIDETFERVPFLEACSRYTIVDLDAVRSVTSFGVKEWLAAIRQVPPSAYVCFVNARPSVAMQFNLVVGFAGNGELVSLYAPFACPSTGEERHVLLDLRKDYPLIASRALPEPDCHPGEKAEFDDIFETYFSYVTSRPPPTVPAQVSRVLDGGASPAKSSIFAVDKDVFANVTALRLRGSLTAKTRLKRVLEGVQGAVLVLLDEVCELELAGTAQLAPLVQAPGVEIAFARVPYRLVDTLVQAVPRAAESIVSVVLDVVDVDGNPAQVEVASRDLSALASGAMTSHASGLAIAPVDPARVAALDALLRPAADVFEAYLERRGAPPTRSKADSGRMLAASVQSGTRGYDILELVGTGGMADIFLAVQQGEEGFRKKVILKKIRSSFALNAQYLEMFLQEARIAARLSHPNIAQILDLGHRGDEYFIALEYVEGADLRKLLNAVRLLKEPMPVDVACLIGSSLAAALSCAHEALDDHGRPLNIVHCDVSPKNILVSKDGIAKLSDFGVASIDRSFVVARPGMVKGTTAYMAPEQVLGHEPAQPTTDVFAAGVVLYECLLGENPFRRSSEDETFGAIREYVPPSPRSVRLDVPASLDRVVMHTLEKEVSMRCRSARELSRALEECVTDCGPPATATRLADWVSGVLARARAANIDFPSPSRTGAALRLPSEPEGETRIIRPLETMTAPSIRKDEGKRS
jgi:serine/threonine protein kinase